MPLNRLLLNIVRETIISKSVLDTVARVERVTHSGSNTHTFARRVITLRIYCFATNAIGRLIVEQWYTSQRSSRHPITREIDVDDGELNTHVFVRTNSRRRMYR
jgi:hypothetical protein